MKQKIEIEVDIPEGYEATGEYRQPNTGEYYQHKGKVIESCAVYDVGNRIILCKKKQYRDPVLPADYNKPAQFSADGKTWVTGTLRGWYVTVTSGSIGKVPWYADISGCPAKFEFCQVECDE